MAAPKFSPVAPLDDARGYESPDHVPDRWSADRPAEAGRQPTGARLGFQGPDQGYALTLAARLRPEVQVQTASPSTTPWPAARPSPCAGRRCSAGRR